VMPPPFFQGVALKEDLRMICSREFCTSVFYKYGGSPRLVREGGVWWG
jgi:hypothetical protein